jgi:hypothetical protein
VNILEAAALLTKIQLGDNREVTDLVVKEWFDTLWDFDVADCMEAVTMHRRESVEYLQPAHIIGNVKRIREARAVEREQQSRLGESEGRWPPKPANYDAMSAAWNDPVAFAREVAIYDQQLVEAGFEPTRSREERRWVD